MRLTCPHCGDRDRREFTWMGAALDRPDAGASAEVWHDYIHLRDNPAGPLQEIWYHDPCGAHFTVTRDTRTHAIAADGGAP